MFSIANEEGGIDKWSLSRERYSLMHCELVKKFIALEFKSDTPVDKQKQQPNRQNILQHDFVLIFKPGVSD